MIYVSMVKWKCKELDFSMCINFVSKSCIYSLTAKDKVKGLIEVVEIRNI